MKKLSHTDNEGRARMVDVGEKDMLMRTAGASGFIRLDGDTLNLIRENAIRKGDVLAVAEVAGVQAAKQTSAMIPLCHNIPLDHVRVTATIVPEGVRIRSEVRCTGKTGVEMEALTAVSIALLTIYDMCKAVDKNMEITGIRLTDKVKSQITV